MPGQASRQGVRKRWHLLPAAPSQQFSALPHLPSHLVQVLYNRGLREPGEVDAFLYAAGELEADPFLLADMERAVARLSSALAKDEPLCVYGDFDVDGVAGTALLAQFLSRRGVKVVPYIPHREREGYGLNCRALEHLRDEGVRLVITVDCGTSSLEEVRYAQALGMEVIVTDHHSIPETLPPAVAVINPRRADSAYPFRELSGVGVAYKLAQALSLALDDGRASVEEYLDLAALGTIVDMVPLTGENRLLARRGLEALNTAPRLGLRELMRAARLTPGKVDAEKVSYAIGPRLNSAGRLDHALVSYRLLTTDSLPEAQEIAAALEVQNTHRQRLTREALERAREKALRQVDRFPLLMVGSRSFPLGVIGLVASHLSGEFYRPAVVVEVGEAVSRGSARSIPQFDIHQALVQCSDLLSRFGGHPQAAGFTVPNQNLSALRQRLLGLAQRALEGVTLEPSLTVDAQVELGDLDWASMRLIQDLAPFGKGNPPPTFLTRGVRVLECRRVGNDHLRLKLHDGRLTWPAVAFGFGDVGASLVTPLHLDIVYRLGVDVWNREEILQLEIEDLRPTG